MEGKKIRAIGTSLILCLAAMTISGCDLKDSESSANAGIEGNKPQGTPPADAKNGGKKKGESKTYQIDSDTKIYKKSGEESTEISVSEINPGDMVSVETDGEKATSITVSDMSAMGQPGQNSQDTSSGK